MAEISETAAVVTSDGLNDKQRKLQEVITLDIHSMEAAREEIKSKVERLNRMWHGERTRRGYHGRSNVSIPFPYWYSESMVPRLMASVFGGRDIFEVIPLPNGTLQGAKGNKSIMNYQAIFEMDAFPHLMGYSQMMERQSIGQMKIKWNPQLRSPEMHLIRPGDLLWDPRVGPFIKKARWKAHRVEMERGELEEGVKTKGYIQESVEAIKSSNRLETATQGDSRGENIQTVSKFRAFFALQEWWGTIPTEWASELFPKEITDRIRGRGRFMPVIALWGMDHLIHVIPNPYGSINPFIVSTDVSDPFGIWGWSENEFIEGLFNATSDMLNQKLDNTTMNINKLWSVLKGSGIQREQLINVPWGYIEVQDHDDIRERETTHVTGDADRSINQLLETMKDTTGLLDQQRGIDKPSVDTASGIQLLLQKSDLRPGLKVQVFQYIVMAGIGDAMLRQNARFLDIPKVGYILGERDPEKALEIWDPQQLQGQYKVYPLSFALAGSRDVRIGQLTNLLNTMRGMELQGQGLDVVVPIVEEILTLADVRKAGRAVEEWKDAREQQKIAAQRQVQQQQVMTRQRLAQTLAQGAAPRPVGIPGSANVPGQLPAGFNTGAPAAA